MNSALKPALPDLAVARITGDPPADEAISQLSGSEIGDCFLLMKGWRGNSQAPPSGLPVPVLRLFESSGNLPAWADMRVVTRAHRLYERYAADLLAMLFYAALPQCYAAADGARVLLHTRRMSDSPRARLMDTAQFVVEAMTRGGMSPEGSAITGARKVRLLHALLRRRILDGGRWDTSASVPINQEEMAGTLLAFSYVSVAALMKMGASVRGADRDAYIHAWNVIGCLLGIHREYLAASFEEAELLTLAIGRRQHRESEEGRVLAAALLEIARSRFPGPLKAVPSALVRYLVAEDTADLLGVPPSGSARMLVSLLRFGFWTRERITQLVPLMRIADVYNRPSFVRAVLWAESRRLLSPGGK